MSRFFAASFDLFQWPVERLGFRALRQRAVSDLTGRVLDLGAGTGLNFPYYGPSTKVTAVEPDPDMRRRALKRAEASRTPIQLIDARAEELPFPDHSFDAAVITLVLCSVGDVDRSLAELCRVLRPGAPVRLIEHVRAPQAPVAALQEALTPLQRHLAGNCHLDRRTAEALRAAGFVTHQCRSHLAGSLLELAVYAPRLRDENPSSARTLPAS